MSEESFDLATAEKRRTLWIVLLLNLGLAVGFGVTGIAADSSALIANGLDNASDGLVYIISLLALSRSQAWKRGAALTSGVLLLLFAAGVLFDAGRRYFSGSEPLGPTMIGMAIVAALVNGLHAISSPQLQTRLATKRHCIICARRTAIYMNVVKEDCCNHNLCAPHSQQQFLTVF